MTPESDELWTIRIDRDGKIQLGIGTFGASIRVSEAKARELAADLRRAAGTVRARSLWGTASRYAR